MSNQNQQRTPSPTLPPPSKLPKFFQRQASRDRAKSVTDQFGSASTSSTASGSSLSTSSDITPSPSTKPRKSSKFSILRDKEDKKRRSSDLSSSPPLPDLESPTADDPPVIVEPVVIPRPRPRPDRPIDTSVEPSRSLYSSASSTSRIGDLPTRLSGWFSHTFSTSTTDLSLPSLLSQSASSSPSRAAHTSALLTAAKHGKGHLDKAMRFLLDSDSTPDRCSDSIWILGVQHPGYEPPPPTPAIPASLSSSTSISRRNSISFRSSSSSLSTSDLVQTTPSKQPNPAANWPAVFYADFTSRVWLTYRSQFTPIRDVRLADISGDTSDVEPSSSPQTAAKARSWNWGGREKGWTSDTGWGCMLRTGQSLLANALVHIHLGRDWRRPPHPVHTADYATYVQIITWFLDTPSPDAPFSVHRMALAGKELGKDVGQWFGPSTAAGAIRTLVNNFPEAGLGVSVATDGTLFQTDVFAASHFGGGNARSTRRHQKVLSTSWGERPVLLLIGLRLGLDGVNPVYYDTIKLLYTFPQSVGIAGGRPSSSYYFVGSQADNLFYLDPHHARPTIPLRPAPPQPRREDRESTPESDRELSRSQRSPRGHSHHQRAPTSPSSVRTGASSSFSHHAPLSPSPLQQQFSQSSSSTASSESNDGDQSHARHQVPLQPYSRSPPSGGHHARWHSASQGQSQRSPPASDTLLERELTGLDPVQEHYVTAYHSSELKTFHCERVRKMPLSGLDPSMLLGFLCRDETDWWDFRKRVGDLPRTIISVQDEPPTWPSDSDEYMGLESISEPDDLDMDLGDDDEVGGDDDADEGEEQFFDTRSASASTSSASGEQGDASDRSGKSKGDDADIDTEDDPVDPITPGPHSRFSVERQFVLGQADKAKESDKVSEGPGDIEDDWVDPLVPSSPACVADDLSEASDSQSRAAPKTMNHPIPSLSTTSNGGLNNKSNSRKNRNRAREVPVPVPRPVVIPLQEQHYPFPVAEDAPSPEPRDRSRSSSATNKGMGPAGKRMHTARARDGGRTQSGGVKGILTAD